MTTVTLDRRELRMVDAQSNAVANVFHQAQDAADLAIKPVLREMARCLTIYWAACRSLRSAGCADFC
ncbi:hypothetical protein [Thiomonas intermedia]|uniref:hypothetical protein n=1 Tax=Thiomonas intermedia TaxID=926 RepID=UPI0012AC3CC1|nr:hypothetical protein [Thiomonas intermedia]